MTPPANRKDEEDGRDLGPTPSIIVLGHLGKGYGVKLSWSTGMHQVSASRLKWLVEELGVDCEDDPSSYQF